MSTGNVCGEAANKYPEFRYRMPLKPQRPTMLSLDPNRINPMYEYPRDRAFFEPDLRYVELANYEIEAKPDETKGFGVVEIWLKPNKYTLAKKPKMIFQANITLQLLYDFERWPAFEREILKDAFR